jgi:hypothetical protein
MGFVQLVQELAEVWRIERDRRRKQKEQYRIEYAFTSGGRKYYCYEDITNLPYQRGRAALTCFNEIEMRCTREFLLKYTEAMDDVLQSNKIDIYKINSLNGLLKDRLNLTADLELCYRLAAIVFFDDTEKPEVYEPEYAAKKIERWRKDMKVSDFFMQKPLKELMPFLNNAVGDFDAFFLLNEELNKIHSDLTRITGSIKDKTHTMNGKK